MIKKAFAGIALAILAVISIPAAAQAQPYAPVAPPSITVTAGGTFTATFTGFAPGEPVSFTLTGEFAASATIGSVVTAVETSPATVKNADSSGAASVTVTLPTNASGSYTLSATGLESGTIAQTFVTVVSNDPAGTGSGTGVGSGSSDGSLPNTGAMDPTLGIWAGGGLLALGAAFVIVLTVVRRQKATN
ncbi:LPXTG cell wall anchor domain-containing protein [Herbiconiux solani]|uniref:LPXTG cell wall anchor domain-containing protein n=1 Tax=Herbiconiux solani TaxID=661329 RepID=UPI000826E06A|nr:LPXTG cell wall anchor domain-containing protein [Herbiconiux solani]